MPNTRSQTKTIRELQNTDECKKVNPAYEKCVDVAPVPPKFDVQSPIYRTFLNRIIRECIPYTGKKVFIVKSNNRIMFVCPQYKLRIGKQWYSVNTTENGYIYVHFLKDFVQDTDNCLYNGDHITIGPTRDSHIHFHTTTVQAVVYNKKVLMGSSFNDSWCTLSIKDMKEKLGSRKAKVDEKKQWFSQQVCENEHSISFHKTTAQMLRNNQEMIDRVFAILMKGFS